MVKRKGLIVSVLAAICVLVVLVAAVPTMSSPGAGDYNPWYDANDDGKIDGKDIALPALIYGSAGQNITKASLQYDSGWLNVTDKWGQTINVTHNLNIADWNDPNMTVDITGKTTPDGRLQRYLGLTGQQGWNKTYGGTDTDWAFSLVHSRDGGYALAGYTGPSWGGGDFWLVKTDADGNMQWNKTYGGTGDDVAWSVVQTDDGGYALAGYGFANLVKTDADGNLQWANSYGGAAYALVQTTDGGYALAGANGDFWLVKTDADGNMQWNKTYGGTGGGEAYSLVQTGDGGYALAGQGFSSGAIDSDFCLVKTDADGNMQWNKTYGGTDIDFAWSLVQTGGGGYAIAGPTGSFGAGGTDAWLVKTDADGNMQWNKTYGGTGTDVAYSVVQTGDGGYAITGWTDSFGAGGYDFWLVRTDASGNIGESGLVWVGSTFNNIILYRGAADPCWNYVRVQIWKRR